MRRLLCRSYRILRGWRPPAVTRCALRTGVLLLCHRELKLQIRSRLRRQYRDDHPRLERIGRTAEFDKWPTLHLGLELELPTVLSEGPGVEPSLCTRLPLSARAIIGTGELEVVRTRFRQ